MGSGLLPNGARSIVYYEANGLGVVLADNGGAMPFVTWVYPTGQPEATSSGDYFTSLQDAIRSWEDRTGVPIGEGIAGAPRRSSGE